MLAELQLPFEQGAGVLLRLAAKRLQALHRAVHAHGGEPVHRLVHGPVEHGAALRFERAAVFPVFLRRLPQGIHVEQLDARPLADRRVDVARHGEVEQEQGAVRPGHLPLPQHRVRRRRGRDDHTAIARRLIPLRERPHTQAGELPAQREGVVHAAAAHRERGGAAVREVAQREARHLPAADDERGLILHRPGRLQPPHADGAERERVFADVQRGFHLLGRRDGGEKHARELLPGRTRAARAGQRFLHLAEDLVLPQHEGIEARGHFKQVGDGLPAAQAEERGRERRFPLEKQGARRLLPLLGEEIDLAPVAGGEHGRLGCPGGGQPIDRLQLLCIGERSPGAQSKRRLTEAHAAGKKLHVRLSSFPPRRGDGGCQSKTPSIIKRTGGEYKRGGGERARAGGGSPPCKRRRPRAAACQKRLKRPETAQKRRCVFRRFPV